MFTSVLVANRGEIAVRVIRTLRRMGIASIAVYSDADRDARHVRDADDALRLGPAAAARSYLSVERVINAAVTSGAQAVHPGYGFLSENATFAAACAEAGVVFIGPPVSAIAAMGDKIRAKQTVEAAGVPVVPGRHTPGLTDDDLVAAAHEIGFPVLLKPSAGGGGKGMRRVEDADGLRTAISGARREALGSFGDDTLLIERFVASPRHIEIQLLADAHGAVVHLGERECSLQRRHQKVIEEAPSVLLDPASRARMGAAAAEAARAVGYQGAGTVEFIVSADRPGEFFFMEMNTRLQVEHPVTEMVTGLDLVEQQLRVAAGEPLGFGQDEVTLSGHAVEARIYAEDPSRGFLPTGGTVLALREPTGPGVRVDSGLRVGTVVGSDYDPMLAKVVAWGTDRKEAIRRLDAALADTSVLGVTTNTAFLRDLLADPDVLAGRMDTGLIERRGPVPSSGLPDHVARAAALDRLVDREPTASVVDPFAVPGGWRLGAAAWEQLVLQASGSDPVSLRVRGRADGAEVAVGDADPVTVGATREHETVSVRTSSGVRSYHRARAGETLWLGRDGSAWAVHEQPRVVRERAVPAVGPVTAPMPGNVTVVHVSVGDAVVAGQALVVVEAMKMEHTVTAPLDGVVAELPVAVGSQVRMDAVLVVLDPAEAVA